MISKDVSRWFERHLGRCKLGHVGTLDPLAEGVLPILFGRATRLQDYLLDAPKAYEFDVQFGVATTTADSEGEVIQEQAFTTDLDVAQLNQLCAQLVGSQLLTPPIYSAIKYRGRPLYDYARQGESELVPLEDLARRVTIYKLECISVGERSASFRVLCSKGTYVRSIACKISDFLNSCGMVTSLKRVQAAGYTIDQCASIEEIEASLPSLVDYLIPLDQIRLELPCWSVSDGDVVRRLKMGQRMMVDMRYFESGLSEDTQSGLGLRSLDTLLLADRDGRSFGIGSVSLQNAGRIAVVMRRGF